MTTASRCGGRVLSTIITGFLGAVLALGGGIVAASASSAFASTASTSGDPAAATSASAPLHVSADEYSLWDGSRLFLAQGNVTVRHERMLITADLLQYDVDAGQAVFRGNVFYSDEEQELTGNSLQYDLNNGVAVFDGMEAVLYGEGVKGPMFVSGQRVRVVEGEVHMERAVLTTCECTGDTPAYRFVAKELEIYPNDRLVARSVTFYDHKAPLLYLPYLALSLKEKTNRFDMPQIGYSERTGWYVKLTYNYVLKSGLYGALLFDYFQKLGVGGGVRHTYVDNKTGIGTLYAYGVGNELGGADASFAWQRRWTGSTWDVTGRYAYDVRTADSGVEREELNASLTLAQKSRDGDVAADIGYLVQDRAQWLKPETKLTASATWRRRIGDGWDLRLRGELSDETRGGTRRRWLGYAGELQHAAPKYTLVTRIEQQVNPDYKDPGSSGGTPLWTHVSRLPEVTLKLRRMNGFDISFGAARLKEEPSGTGAWRGETQVSLATRTWRLTPAISVNAGGSALGRAYTTDENQLTLQGRAGLNLQIARPLSATLQYNYREVWGTTPFRFDRVSPSETFSTRLNWRSAAVTASLSTTYDLRTEKWGVLSGNATWRMTPNLVLRGSGTYHLYNRMIERIAGTLDWQASQESSVRLGAVYDVPATTWRTLQGDVKFAVGGGWEVGATVIYDAVRDSFTRNHMYVSHTACGCREIRLSYDQVKGEVWVEYHITAFPSSRVALGASEDKLMFESDALADFLKN